VHAPLADVSKRLEEIIGVVVRDPTQGRITDADLARPVPELIEEAARWLKTYHANPVLERIGDRLQVSDMKLLYYYANRTSHLKLPEVTGE